MKDERAVTDFTVLIVHVVSDSYVSHSVNMGDVRCSSTLK
jgi:hypothetical protein